MVILNNPLPSQLISVLADERAAVQLGERALHVSDEAGKGGSDFMRRKWTAWIIGLALLSCCLAAIAVALFYRPCKHQSTEEWLAEVRADKRDEIVVRSINVSEILLKPDESYVPKLIAELGWRDDKWLFMLTEDNGRALLGALAACGGKEAAVVLAAIYADMEVETHVEPTGPYHIPQSNEPLGMYKKRFGDWAWPSVVYAQNTYTAFISPGPI